MNVNKQAVSGMLATIDRQQVIIETLESELAEKNALITGLQDILDSLLDEDFEVIE